MKLLIVSISTSGIVAGLLAAIPAAAQQALPLPDPATITLPNLGSGRDPGVASDGWKHFYFYKRDVAFAQAYADFAECYSYLPVPDARGALPAFVPWGDEPGAKIVPSYAPGLALTLVQTWIGKTIERRAFQSRMRRCMEPRGYERYPLAEEAWKQVIDGYSVNSIAVQAKIASGPLPDADVLATTR